jgi:hypothetical protein
MITVYTIEDCVEVVSGLNKDRSEFKVDSADTTVFKSIAKQISREVALTDRQYLLVRRKLDRDYYRQQFAKKGVASEQYAQALENLRMAIREVNRDKSISLVEAPPKRNISFFGKNPSDVNDTLPWIELSFPWTSSLLVIIEKIQKQVPRECYVHLDGTREHYFRFDETVVYSIVSEFINKEFDIDQELLDFYRELDHVYNNLESYVPGIVDGQLVNFNQETENYLVNKLGEPTLDNIVQYQDRSLLFNIQMIDQSLLDQAYCDVSSLTRRVASRNTSQVLLKPDDWIFEDILQTLNELNRTPTLIVLTADQALKRLRASHQAAKKYVDNSEISVLFRMSNDVDPDFNKYIVANNLNNPVTEGTKVVYICNDKLPKPLLKSGWEPDVVIRSTSVRMQTKLEHWLSNADLVVHYDSTATPWNTTLSSFLATKGRPSVRKVTTI